MFAYALDGRSVVAPVPSKPPRRDDTDFLPEDGIEYGVGAFRGVQTTLDEGRHPGAERRPGAGTAA